MTFITTNYALLLLISPHLCVNFFAFASLSLPPDLHDFSPDSRNPQTAYEGVGTFLACQPPPHYPGSLCTSEFLPLLTSNNFMLVLLDDRNSQMPPKMM